MPHVSRHCWTDLAKGQVKLVKSGQCEFSHPEGIPVDINVRRIGFCGRRVTARLLEDIWYRDAVGMVSIPAGFTWDMASVPEFLWWFVSPFELAYESAFHDANYREQKLTREYADFQFRYLMRQRKQPWYVCWGAWLGVRLGGRKAWDKHARRIKRDQSTK